MPDVMVQEWLRNMVALPDGFERLERYIGELTERCATAEAISAAVVRDAAPMRRRIDELLAAVNREVDARRALRAEFDAFKNRQNTRPDVTCDVRAAPFYLTPGLVAALVGDDHPVLPAGVAEIPVEPVTLVDRPRGSEDPRLAKANDDCLSSPETNNDRLPVPIESDRSADYVEKRRPYMPQNKGAEERHRRDREARELEKQAEGKARIPLGARTEPERRPVPTCGWLERRHERIKRAIDFLNARAMFVQVVNRDALVRTYRVSGKRDPKLAEEVIEIAIGLGMPDEVQP